MEKTKYQPQNSIKIIKKQFPIFIIVILFLYLCFAFLAPFLMRWDHTEAGKIIYSIYGNFCHQFAHRSWFLFGEQSYYPIMENNNAGIKSLQDEFGIADEDLQGSRAIIGNGSAGYKVAICQRDIMIYFSLFVFSLIFFISKNKIQKLSLWLWFVFAIVPMGFDGLWQFLSTINLINIPNYESTPLIRSITGGLFGFFSGWYLLPAIQDTINDEEK